MNEVIVSMNNISKSFPGVKALDHVKFELRSGEVMALLGENGAGKSTMLNAVAGTWLVDEGQILIDNIDVTKLSVYTRDIGLAGIEVYDLLRDEYDIQIELGDIANILAYISIGDRIQDIERLVGALADIKRLYSKDPASMLNTEYINPKVLVSPQTAFYSEKTRLPIRETSGRICAEFVMCYPPGIPILAPGELITDEIIEYVLYAKEKGCSMQGTEDPAVEYLNVL